MIGLLRSALLIAAAEALLLPSAGARADQIDGHWCHADGRNLSIEGSMIITPGGNEIVGNYRRHSIFFTLPADEPNPGTKIAMQQLNDLVMQMLKEGDQEAQTWRRCNAPTA